MILWSFFSFPLPHSIHQNLHLHSPSSKLNAMGLLFLKAKQNNPIFIDQMKVTLGLGNSCPETDRNLWKGEAIKRAPSPFFCCGLSTGTAIILWRRGQKPIFLPWEMTQMQFTNDFKNIHLTAFSHLANSVFVSRKAGWGFDLSIDLLPAIIFTIHNPLSSTVLGMFNLKC